MTNQKLQDELAKRMDEFSRYVNSREGDTMVKFAEETSNMVATKSKSEPERLAWAIHISQILALMGKTVCDEENEKVAFAGLCTMANVILKSIEIWDEANNAIIPKA